jgi:hypothetical protein
VSELGVESSTMVSQKKLLFWIEHNYNVLFEGKHGVGKTSVCLAAFQKASLKFAYFSGATLDPFVDFCGVPVKVDTEDGSYIELILPKHINFNELEAIFMDEYNRTNKKVRNACMELIQFKSINGRPFPKLRFIWAAVNPEPQDGEEGEYDVDRLDPAQKDRFHIHVTIPYKCSKEYFTKKYGSKIADPAIEWWDRLPDPSKSLVSPRRLDYALQVFTDNGDLADVLPLQTAPHLLKRVLAIGPVEVKLNTFIKEQDSKGAKHFLADENNYDQAIKFILKSARYKKFFLPLLSPEKISSLMCDSMAKVGNLVIGDLNVQKQNSVYFDVAKEIVAADTNKRVAKTLKKKLDEIYKGVVNEESDIDDLCCRINNKASGGDVIRRLFPVAHHRISSSGDRINLYNELREGITARMANDAAWKALGIIQAIVAHSLDDELFDNYDGMVGHLNHIIIQLLEQGSSVDSIVSAIGEPLHRVLEEKGAPTVPQLLDYVNKMVTVDDIPF